MSLTLSILRCPDRVPPETRELQGGEYSIGRGPENDWMLPDPERFLSKRHCVLAYRSGSWQVADLSTNGTFLNREADPIGRGQARDLRDGDRLRFGSYEIEIRVAGEEMARGAPGVADDPFTLDPFRAARGSGAGPLDQDPLLRREAEHDPFSAGLASPSINLPADYDPLAPDPADTPFAGPAHADHTPHLDDAFRPGVAHAVIPEDWDRDLAASRSPREAEAPPPHMAPEPVPEPTTAPPSRVAALTPAPLSAAPLTAAPPAPAPPTPAPPAMDGEDLLAAFLRGAAVEGVRPADPAAAMEALGAVFRAFVGGLRQALVARAAIKGEFRIEQTMLQAQRNNPLKFSADDGDALAALLGAGRRTEMGAVEAVTEALRDIRLHELATIAAMQSAVRTLLSELEPAKLRQSAERGGLDFVPAQRKAHAWDAFETAHARIARALEDDFDSVFGKAFARAYERALDEISARVEP